MRIDSGINRNVYSYMNKNTASKNNNASVSNGLSSTGITLNWTGKDGDSNALSCVGVPGGMNFSVFQGDDDNSLIVKGYDDEKQIGEYSVNPQAIDSEDASFVDMLAFTTYTDKCGYTSSAVNDFLIAAQETSQDKLEAMEKKNYKETIKEMMNLQYSASNLAGYLSYKKLYDLM